MKLSQQNEKYIQYSRNKQENAKSAKIYTFIKKRQNSNQCITKSDWPGIRKLSLNNLHINKFKVPEVPIQKVYHSKKDQTIIKKVNLVEPSSKSLSFCPKIKNRSTKKMKLPSVQQESALATHTDSFFQNKKLMNTMQQQRSINTFHDKQRTKSFNHLEKYNEKQKQQSRKRLKDYVIQFEAFNYISKIIDTPDPILWAKFVHLKQNNSHDQH